MVGETPRPIHQRLRLDRGSRAAGAGTDRVVDVALDSGFASHEVFTRAFTRRFGRSPERYRAGAHVGGTRGPRAPRRDHRGDRPCLTLYHVTLDRLAEATRTAEESVMPTPTIERQELQPQPP
jgi:AraC family transcriptional regulator